MIIGSSDENEGVSKIPPVDYKTIINTSEVSPELEELPTLTGGKFVTVIISLVIAVFMASANENMVATAIGAITTDLHASGDVTWVIASYLLLATASQPLYGKFSDIFGRRLCLLFATLIFLVGSTGCGVATSLPMLAFFRGLDGIGAGGLTSLGYIVLGDLVPLNKRGSFMSLLQLTFAVSGVIGPVVGGLLVDLASWRMVFFITIPMGVLLLVSVFWLPSPPPSPLRNQLARVDVGGGFTLVSGTILIILGCNWGGKEYPWCSLPVILCFGFGFLLLSFFLKFEKVASEPLFPSRIFNRNTTSLTIINVSLGFCLFNFTTHLPLYFQHAQHQSATATGFLTIPVYLGVALTAALSGFLVDKFKSPLLFMRVGMVLIVLGCSLSSLIRPTIPLPEELLFSSLVGVGIGLNLQLAIILAQASNSQEDLAVATALMRYSLALGGTLGLALHGALFNNLLVNQLYHLLPDHPELAPILASPSNILSALATLSNQAMVRSVLLTCYRLLFLSLLPVAMVGLIASLRLHSTVSRSS